jgi:hypothetical protein
VRGAEGIQVVAVLALAGVATGAGLGLLVGLVWALTGAAPLGEWPAAAVALTAVAADVVARLTGRLRPLALGRQVPQLWGRLFGARTTALLYGARLGVGPLTILTTWTWWAALAVGASLGPWPSAAVGAAFALTRTVTMVAAVAGTREGPGMSTRIGAISTMEPVVAWATMVVVGVSGGWVAW